MGGTILEFSMDKTYLEGYKQGKEEAERKFFALFSELDAVGRADDIIKCKNNKAFLYKLYEEFQIA